jgi:TrmH family RNA methyltransferase
MPPPLLITSRTNARVKALRAAFTEDGRDGLIAIEGSHLIEEALRSGFTLRAIFLAENYTPTFALPPDAPTFYLTRDVFTSVVATEAPQGVTALIHIPDRSADLLNAPDALILIAAGLQDPGNLGTLIRSAEAFGATCVLTTPGTVSAWNQKTIRASAGSVFRLPIFSTTIDQLRERSQKGLHLIAAVARSGTWPLQSPRGPRGILIGNEGAGLPKEILSLAKERVTIPCRVESLNAAVAGSLLLFEASRESHSVTTPRASTLTEVS